MGGWIEIKEKEKRVTCLQAASSRQPWQYCSSYTFSLSCVMPFDLWLPNFRRSISRFVFCGYLHLLWTFLLISRSLLLSLPPYLPLGHKDYLVCRSHFECVFVVAKQKSLNSVLYLLDRLNLMLLFHLRCYYEIMFLSFMGDIYNFNFKNKADNFVLLIAYIFSNGIQFCESRGCWKWFWAVIKAV